LSAKFTEQISVEVTHTYSGDSRLKSLPLDCFSWEFSRVSSVPSGKISDSTSITSKRFLPLNLPSPHSSLHNVAYQAGSFNKPHTQINAI
jgi:hypothetical protein